MKKLLLLILTLSLLCSCFVGCDKLPDGVYDTVDPLALKIPGLNKFWINQFHEHDFKLVKETPNTCTEDGSLYYECACGDANEVAIPAAHSYVSTVVKPVTCYSDGTTRHKCSVCGDIYVEKFTATGEHVFDENAGASRIVVCENSPCVARKDHGESGKYKDTLVYSFTEDDLTAFYNVFDELDAIIKAAASYDATLHAYSEGTELEAEYLAMEAKYEELYEILEYITGQYQMAQIEYHMDMSSDEKKTAFDYISEVRTDLVADFYSFSQPIFDSMYREFYYYGMSEEEITAFIFESSAVADEEYKAAKDENTQIELEFDAISNPASDPTVLELYAQFVANNNFIAEKMGYDNYLEYAYENMYSRDYTYKDVQAIREYVKHYIVPVYISTYAKWNKITADANLSSKDIEDYYKQVDYSFFETLDSNRLVNDYIDLLAFPSDAEKQLSFSEEFDNLFLDGNLFRGEYEGAYVTYIYGANTPIAYFGEGYNNPFTVVHEFGHYMNSKYSDEQYNQSFDLLEMHSQGNEILYLAFLDGKLSEKGYNLCETYQLLVMLDTIVTALAVDTFEQAVYTNYYDGYGSQAIMEDGAITSNEYDTLFKNILQDFGASGYVYESYWRYVTIHAPCYYVSYSISALSVLQLYPTAKTDFEAAKDAYLDLYTYIDDYVDDDDYITTEAVLERAGLYSYNDEELYKKIFNYFL